MDSSHLFGWLINTDYNMFVDTNMYEEWTGCSANKKNRVCCFVCLVGMSVFR